MSDTLLQLRLPLAMKQALLAEAKRIGVSMSDLVRLKLSGVTLETERDYPIAWHTVSDQRKRRKVHK